LAIVKSELIKELKKSYPNFLTKDLNKVIEIILKEIKETLQRGERVEFRNFGTFSTNIQKASIRRNPKTGQKVSVPQKKTIKWKMSRELFKKLNNEKE
jgi:integration host factor subunit beta